MLSPRTVKRLRRAQAAVIASLPVALARSAAEGFSRGLTLVREARVPVSTFRADVPPGVPALVVGDLRPFSSPTRNGPRLPPASQEEQWRSATLVRVLLELGYDVDVVADQESLTPPAKPYALIVAMPPALSRLGPRLSPDCLRVLHVNTADTLFQNAAELHRLLALKDRRGVILPPVRYRTPTSALREASCVIVQGDEFTASTYEWAKKPIYSVPLVSGFDCPSPVSKDFEQSRRRFVWLGDEGLVAKGLDLVLEAFAGLPECSLTVCGPLRAQTRFAAAYARELYRTSHIHSRDTTRLSGREFIRLAAASGALIHPSCAEGQAREVVDALQCGLTPIISRESGVDVDDAALILSDCSVAGIRKAVIDFASLPSSKRQEMAMRAWTSASVSHSPTAVAERYRRILGDITSNVRAHASP